MPDNPTEQSSQPPATTRLAVTLGLPALVIVALFVFKAQSFVLNRIVPGDLGDARFNIYVLEHAFQWLKGGVASYISPPIFYPFPGALLFSDTHAGSAFIYILFRAIGISKFSSFTLWFFAGYALTFLAAYWALLRFGFTPFCAVIAAVVFAFSLPSLAQFGHAQLVYRFGVPLAFLSLWRLLETGSARHALWLVFWTAWQTLCTVYIGLFLAAILAVAAIAMLFAGGGVRQRLAACRNGLAAMLRPASRREAAGLIAALLLAMIAAAATAALLYEHQMWSRIYGFRRSWDEIASMIPRPASYLNMDVLPYWNAFYRRAIGVTLPAHHEHNLFAGLGASGLFVAGLAATISRGVATPRRRLGRAMLATLGIVVCLTTMFGGVTLYSLLVGLPGLNSIRAVTRIGLVLMFPVAILVAVGMTGLLRSKARMPAFATAGVLVLMVGIEIAMTQLSTFRIEESEARTRPIVREARLKAEGIANPILFVRESSELPYKAHLDAMLAAQDLNWPTVNGYSGNDAPGFDPVPGCDTPAKLFSAYQSWRQSQTASPDLRSADLLGRIVYVGWTPCEFGAPGGSPAQAALGPLPDPAIAPHVILTPLSLGKEGGKLSLGVSLANRSDQPLHVNSFAPVSLSWRFVPAGQQTTPPGWTTRYPLPADVAGGGTVNVVIPASLPTTPGDYWIEVSLVAEHAFWFHDRGSAILRFPQPLTSP